jgi:hypothetical protein
LKILGQKSKKVNLHLIFISFFSVRGKGIVLTGKLMYHRNNYFFSIYKELEKKEDRRRGLGGLGIRRKDY